MFMLMKGLAVEIENCEPSKKVCKICVKGKQSRRLFISSKKRSYCVLDLIHSDFCGPMSVDSIGGSRYFMTFVDNYSRKIYVYFLKRKSGAPKPKVFTNFKALVKD